MVAVSARGSFTFAAKEVARSVAKNISDVYMLSVGGLKVRRLGTMDVI